MNSLKIEKIFVGFFVLVLGMGCANKKPVQVDARMVRERLVGEQIEEKDSHSPFFKVLGQRPRRIFLQPGSWSLEYGKGPSADAEFELVDISSYHLQNIEGIEISHDREKGIEELPFRPSQVLVEEEMKVGEDLYWGTKRWLGIFGRDEKNRQRALNRLNSDEILIYDENQGWMAFLPERLIKKGIPQPSTPLEPPPELQPIQVQPSPPPQPTPEPSPSPIPKNQKFEIPQLDFDEI